MNKRKHLLLLILVSLLIGMSWQNGQGQIVGDIQLSSVEVTLLPEFNHPYMLVITEIELDQNTTIPSEVIIQIPADARVLQVGNLEAEDRTIALNFTTIQVGNWQDIRFTTNTPAIQIEYTDTNLVKQEEQRLFEYQWLSIYPVDSLTLQVRQPIGASEILTDPPLNEIVDEVTGYEYYRANVGAVPPSEIFSFTLMYTKDGGDNPYPELQVDAKMPITEGTPGRSPSPLSVVTWLVMVAVSVLVMVGLYYWWFRVKFINKRDRMVQGVGIMNPEKQAVFCHECGMRSRPGDSYCSNCGTELRKPTTFEQPLPLRS